jgi:hypothetical protein
VILRYGRGRIHGYQMLKSPGFPCRVGDRFRLDELIVWAQDVPPASCPAARSRRADQPRHAIRR